MNIIDYDLIEDLSILYDSKIILYGTGFWAEKTFYCLKEANVCPDIICKTNATTEKFHGLVVESFSSILNKFDDNRYLLIIASVDYYNEMLDMCRCLKKTKICTLYGLYISLKLHINENILPEKFEKKIKSGLEISHNLNFSRLKMSAINRFVQAALLPEGYIWIFQPGKVGSQSIWNSIQDKSIQFHTLATAYRYADIDKDCLDYYLNLIQNKKIKIISAIREPISRDISAFFQNSDLELWPYHNFNSNIFTLCGRDDESEIYMDVCSMKKRCPLWEKSLNDSYEKFTRAVMYYEQDVFSWFDHEIKKILNLDIYDYPFDQGEGYNIIEKDNIQILILKMEYLSDLENVIGDFINDSNYKLLNRNKALDKMYYYAYNNFKKNIKIPKDYFEFYYSDNSKYKHFYSSKEINANYKYWKKYVSEK